MRIAGALKLGFLLSATDKMSSVVGSAVDKSTDKLNAFERRTSKIAKGFVGFGARMAGIGALVGTGLYRLANSTANFAVDAYRNAQKVGLAFDTYQKLGYALQQSGVDASGFNYMMQRLNRTMDAAASGNQNKMALFSDLGIAIKDSSGQLRSQEAILKDLADVYKNVEDGPVKVAHALEMLGRQGANLIPLLNGGSDALKELMADAYKFGIISEKDAHNAIEFSNRLGELQRVFQNIRNEIGLALIPTFEKWLGKARDIVLRVRGWIAENRELAERIGRIALAISAFLVVGGSLSILIGSFIFIFGKLTAVIRGVQMAFVATKTVIGFAQVAIAGMKGTTIAANAATRAYMLTQGKATTATKAYAVGQKMAAAATWLFSKALWANPITWIIGLIIALGVAVFMLIRHWDWVTEKLGKAWEWIKGVFSSGWEWIKGIWSGVSEWFSGIWDRVKGVFSSVWEWIKKLFLRFHPIGLVIQHWETIVAWFRGLWDRVKTVFVSAWDGIGNFFGTLKERFTEWGRNIIQGLVDGIRSMISAPIDAIRELGSNITGRFRNLLGISSPSKIFAEYGLNITQGLSGGIEKGSYEAVGATQGLALQTVRAASAGNSYSTDYHSYGGASISFSPVINVSGGGGDVQSSVMQALSMGYREFEKMMDRYISDKNRLAFAD